MDPVNPSTTHDQPALQVDKRIPGARGLAASLLARAPRVCLDWDTRSRSRFAARDEGGRSLAVFLPRGSVLRDGDALVAVDGSLLRVCSAAQQVLQVRADTPLQLLRAAYHLGNRHVPLELRADVLQIEPDPVLRDMLLRMGLQVLDACAAFEPEAGAYDPHEHAPARPHAHAHGHAHDHHHDHHHVHEHHHAHPGHEHPASA